VSVLDVRLRGERGRTGTGSSAAITYCFALHVNLFKTKYANVIHFFLLLLSQKSSFALAKENQFQLRLEGRPSAACEAKHNKVLCTLK